MSRRLRLLDDLVEFPATWSLCIVWVLVYVAMLFYQGTRPAGTGLLAVQFSPATIRHFGSLSTEDFKTGELWRTVTATFLHGGHLHLALNLIGLFQLGRIVESWYGSAQFLAVYVVIGALGNTLAGVGRLLIQPHVNNHSLGGSTVVLGLVALVAVVGWRSRTRFGDFIRAQMIAILAITALQGYFLPEIDNYAHAGGALVGAAIGFAHRTLIRTIDSRRARRLSLLGAAIVLIACVGAQLRANRAEVVALERNKATREQALRNVQELGLNFIRRKQVVDDINQITNCYGQLAYQNEGLQPIRQRDGRQGLARLNPLLRANLRTPLTHLKAHPEGLDTGPTAEAFRKFLEIAARAQTKRPTPGEVHAFEIYGGPVFERAVRDLEDALRKLRASGITIVPR